MFVTYILLKRILFKYQDKISPKTTVPSLITFLEIYIIPILKSCALTMQIILLNTTKLVMKSSICNNTQIIPELISLLSFTQTSCLLLIYY